MKLFLVSHHKDSAVIVAKSIGGARTVFERQFGAAASRNDIKCRTLTGASHPVTEASDDSAAFVLAYIGG